MTKRKNKHRLFQIFILFSLVFCLLFPVRTIASMMTVDEEIKLGKEMMAGVHRYYEFVDNDFAVSYLNDLGQHISGIIDNKLFPNHFYLIQDASLNAFAGPGGYIFFFSGLIEIMDSVDELGAVMCHEIGHVSARHIAHRIEKSKKIGIASLAGILVGVFAGGKAAGAIMAGTTAAGAQAGLHYSRNDERHADQLGFKYMLKAGFKPAGMVTLLQKLSEGNWSSTGAVPSYLLTHPGGVERVANVDMMAYEGKKEVLDSPIVKKLREGFPYFKSVIMAKNGKPEEVRNRFEKEISENMNKAAALFGLGILSREMSELDRAESYFESALVLEPESLPVLRELGDVCQLRGKNREAIKIFNKALSIDDNYKPVLFALAGSYLQLEDYSKAIIIYEKLKTRPPVKNEVYYQLGIAYGRENRLVHAHYNSGIFFKKTGKIRDAVFHFRKALKLSEKDSFLRGKIKKELEPLGR